MFTTSTVPAVHQTANSTSALRVAGRSLHSGVPLPWHQSVSMGVVGLSDLARREGLAAPTLKPSTWFSFDNTRGVRVGPISRNAKCHRGSYRPCSCGGVYMTLLRWRRLSVLLHDGFSERLSARGANIVDSIALSTTAAWRGKTLRMSTSWTCASLS